MMQEAASSSVIPQKKPSSKGKGNGRGGRGTKKQATKLKSSAVKKQVTKSSAMKKQRSKKGSAKEKPKQLPELPPREPEVQELLGTGPVSLANKVVKVASDCSGLCPEGLAVELALPGYKSQHTFASELCKKKRCLGGSAHLVLRSCAVHAEALS